MDSDVEWRNEKRKDAVRMNRNRKRWVCWFILGCLLLTGCTGQTAKTASWKEPQSQSTSELSAVRAEPDGAAEKLTEEADPASEQEQAERRIPNTVDVSALHSQYITDTEPGSYTLMIYMVGSNLESQARAASNDLQEMMDSSMDPSLTNVVVYAGGTKTWGLLPDSGNYTLHMTSQDGANVFDYQRDQQDPNMGEPETLSAFLNQTVEQYPAEHYGLILWDHGSGPIYGYGIDEKYDDDRLTLTELKGALDNSPFDADRKLDWIGFDACLMADIEVAAVLSDYAWYQVASQETEPGAGWDYSFLSVFNETADPTVIAGNIINSYTEYNLNHSRFDPDYTLALLDLGCIQQGEQAVEALFSDLVQNMGDSLTQQVQSRRQTKEFDAGAGFDLVDLGSLAQQFEAFSPDGAAEIQAILPEIVLCQGSNLENVSGLSVYFPYSNMEAYEERKEQRQQVFQDYDQVSVSESYLSYLELYAQTIAQGAEQPEGPPAEEAEDSQEKAPEGSTQEPETVQEDDEVYRIQLTPEQLETLDDVCYNVLEKSDGLGESEEALYTPVLLRKRLKPDENGVVEIPKNPMVFQLQSSSEDETAFWPMVQLSTPEGEEQYRSFRTSMEGPRGALADTDPTWVSIRVEADSETGACAIRSIYYESDNASTAGKNDAELEHYDALAYVSTPYCMEENTPIWNWQTWNGVLLREMYYEGQLWLRQRVLSELEGEFAAQVVIRDIYGNETALELMPLDSADAPEEYTETVDGVTGTYHLYEDHAVLKKLETTTEKDSFTIPAEVQGKPVTEIDSYAVNGTEVKQLVLPESVESLQQYAFANGHFEKISLPRGLEQIPICCFFNCNNLQRLSIPEGVTHVGRMAFSGCDSLTHLSISAGVTYIGDGAFMDCRLLTNLNVQADNPCFMVEENAEGNVLYSADQTQLIACPGVFHSSYTIPEGVEVIRDFAFYGCYTETIPDHYAENYKTVIGYGLVEVTFPSTLREIGDEAFYDCTRFESLDLPENLESIGMAAFGKDEIDFYSGDLENNTLPDVYIGAKVGWIGEQAFAAYLVGEFHVAEDNWYFSTRDGMLMTKNGNESVDIYARW